MRDWSVDSAFSGKLMRVDFRFGISRSLSPLRNHQHGCHLGRYGIEAGTPCPMSILEPSEPAATRICEDLGFRNIESDLVDNTSRQFRILSREFYFQKKY